MPKPVIHSLYDAYLKSSGKGQIFSVELIVIENGKQEIQHVHVWAKNESEAKDRAILDSKRAFNELSETHEDKRMGLIFPTIRLKKQTQKGFWPLFKRIFGVIFSPLCFWKFRSIQKGTEKIVKNSGYELGYLTKISIAKLVETNTPSSSEEILEPDLEQLKRAYIVCFLTLSLWIFIFIFGFVFFLLGIHPGIVSKAYLGWFNPYLIGGLMSLICGGISSFNVGRDLLFIHEKLTKKRSRQD